MIQMKIGEKHKVNDYVSTMTISSISSKPLLDLFQEPVKKSKCPMMIISSQNRVHQTQIWKGFVADLRNGD